MCNQLEKKDIFLNICIFKVFFQHNIHKHIFNTFFSKLYPIFLQLNLNLAESKFHTIKLKFI